MSTPPTVDKPTLFEKASDFFKGGVKIEYLIHKLFEVSSLVSITGPSGQFKSFVAVCIACCVATGKRWNGRATKQGAVLYLAGEGHSGIKRRVAAWCQVNGVTLSELEFYLSKSTLMMDGTNTDAIVSECNGADIALIVIDTTARHLDGHENDTRDMCRYIACVDDLKKRLNATAILVHHTGHDTSRGRGNTSYKAALDCEVMCDRGTLMFSKMKDREPPEPISFKLNQVTLYDGDRPAQDTDGDTVTSCTVVYGEKSFSNRHVSEKKIDRQNKTLLEIIEKHTSGEVEEIRPIFYEQERHRLNDPDRKPGTLKTSFSRAIIYLLEAGKITQNGSILQAAQTAQDGTRRHNVPACTGTNGTHLLRECADVPSVPSAEPEFFSDDEFDFCEGLPL